jgi:hypothetical protein
MKYCKHVVLTFVAVFICFAVLPAFAQSVQSDSGVDSLFDNPAADVTNAEPVNTVSTLDNFVAAKPISFRGSLSSGVGIVAGWNDWPVSFESFAAVIPSGYFSFQNSLSWDARLSQVFSFSATLLSIYPAGITTLLSNYLNSSSALPATLDQNTLVTLEPFSLSVDEMFFDYSIAEKLFFRIGKQANTWGNERIFTFTNLISDGSAGLAIKGYVPFGGNGITVAILDQGAWHPDSTYPGLHTMAYLSKFDFVLGKVELQVSGRYRSAEGIKTVAALKTSVFGIDLFHESMLSFLPTGDQTYTTVSGFYWQGFDSNMQIYGEYAYLGGSGYSGDHRFSLASELDLGHLWQGRVKIGVKWDHALADSSGSILPAIVLQPLPYVSLKIGLPILYGATNSIYVATSGDPDARRESIVVAATIAVNY